MRFSTLVVVVSAAFLLSSCGKKDSSNQSQGAEPPPAGKEKPAEKATGKPAVATPVAAPKTALGADVACGLVTPADAAAALGEETKPGKPGVVGCTWNASGGGVKFVTLTLRDGKMWSQAKQISQDMAKQSSKTYQELPGVGDAAFFLDVAGLQVVVRVGKRYAELSMVGPKDAAAKQRLVELAKKVAAKL